MEFLRYIGLVTILLVVHGLLWASSAVEVTIGQARHVAETFVEVIQARQGSWGGQPAARVVSIEPIKREDRMLGYACHVEPTGYVVVSLYRELAPIRAYSTRSRLDLADDQLGDVVKVFQEIVHDGLEERLGRAIAPDDDLSSYLPVEFTASWEALSVPVIDPATYPPQLPDRGRGIDYSEGETLLTTSWNQTPPYNNFCPAMGCEWSGYDYYNWNAWVGCVATAGAQIAKYWNWPPTGVGTGYDQEWDWPNMGARYFYDQVAGLFQTETELGGSWHYSTGDELDAVAMISAWMADGVNMDFGCDASSSHTYDLEGALQDHFRYSTSATVRYRTDVDYSQWVSSLRQQFDNNQPVAYRIPGHAVVADGWDEEAGEWFFHIVYGHNGSDDGWWTCAEIPGGGSTDEHYIVMNIYPINSLGGAPLGSYSPPADYPYRYMKEDINTADAEFLAGHTFQVLGSGLTMECWDSGPDLGLRFFGAPGSETAFFMYGDPDDNTRIKINDGAIKMTQGGGIAFH